MSEEPAHGLVHTADRIGQHVWVERQLFAWWGAWSGIPAIEPRATVFAGEMSARHGWHAELLLERLPALREIEPESVVAPADDAVRAFVEAVCTPPAAGTATDDPDALLDALAGQVRVLLPALVASYRSIVEDARPAADGSLRRWLAMVLADDIDEWERGEALLRSLVRTPAQVERVIARQRESELLLLGCEVFPG